MPIPRHNPEPGDRRAADAPLRPPALPRDCSTLPELRQLSFKSQNALFNDLTALQQLTQECPLALPTDGRYRLEWRDGALHIHRLDQELVRFVVAGEAAPLAQVVQGLTETTIEWQGSHGAHRIVLHRQRALEESSSSGAGYTERTTSPWRSSSWQERSSAPSESHGAAPSGER